MLGLCQAATTIITSMLVTISALVGQQLAGRADLATVPFALQFVAMILTAFPASLLMRRIGRTAAFRLGALIGVGAAALCTVSVLFEHFILFCIGSFVFGVFNSIALFYRFAAADVVDAGYRSRAISYVMAGGVLAAFVGPNLATWTRMGLGVPFAASFAALAGVGLVLFGLTLALRIPTPTEQERRGASRPLSEIVRRPRFAIAVLSAMIGYGAMNLVMTATPLAMHAHSHPFAATAFVIQWHIVAMYAPSFFTGHLIHRFGVFNILLSGGALLALCVALNFSGTTVVHFWLGLVLLGVGWNFLYVGGTTLLTEAYAPAEKAKCQGLNDFAVFTTVALTAAGSGLIHTRFGWEAVNAAVIPAILVVLLAVFWLRQRERKFPETVDAPATG